MVLVGLALAQTAPLLGFSDLYGPGGVRGLVFSGGAKALEGKPVSMQGYVAAPPGGAGVFVLTQRPKQVCAPCGDPADWPRDAAVVFMPGAGESPAPRTDEVLVRLPAGLKMPPGGGLVRVTGRLELGQQEDPQTGFVSLVRIYAERVEEAK